MWDESSDDIPYLPASTNNPQLHSSNRPRIFSRSTREQDSSSSNSDLDPNNKTPSTILPVNGPSGNQLRWGRSNFSEDEIRALETPLEEEGENPSSQSQNTNENNYENTSSVYFAKKHSSNNDSATALDALMRPSKMKRRCQKSLGVVLVIIPALCFAAAAHFINDIMTDFKLFSASFSVFQGVFWPSFLFLVIDLISGRKPYEDDDVGTEYPSGCLSLLCLNGRWKLSLLLLLHSWLSAIAMIAQLLSIQRLNISVSLALSFSPEVYIILLSYINRERRCSLELVIFSSLTYSGFILVGIPAMISPSNRLSEDLTAGLVASLISMGLAIPASFILSHLRKGYIPDSLIATSFAFHGSLFSLIIKIFMDATMDINFDSMSLGWAFGLITLVLIGTVVMILESKFGWKRKSRFQYSNISRARMLIFMFSCFWELIRQGIWNTFPDVYDIFGSLLVVLAFLLSVGFEAWTFTESDEVKNSSFPFQFIPWLFSRTTISNYHSSKHRK